MSLPLFSPIEDPGPSFLNVLKKLGYDRSQVINNPETGLLTVPHGTTIVAIRYKDGVLMAGDRRATEANRIAHRGLDKVFPSDSHSVIGIAGAAGIAMEMVKLFQTQLSHFEKVEGTSLSLEGKANQLSHLIKSNFQMAMMGLAVVPLFAGYDKSRKIGRIFSYDVTGGYYEEKDYQATGSGGRDARSVIKLGFKESLTKAEAVNLAVRALYDAADEDSATGGPDLVRGIYPKIAVVTKEGYSEIKESTVREAFLAIKPFND